MYGALEEFGLRDNHFEEDGEIISRKTIEQSIEAGIAYRIFDDEKVVGGAVLRIEVTGAFHIVAVGGHKLCKTECGGVLGKFGRLETETSHLYPGVGAFNIGGDKYGDHQKPHHKCVEEIGYISEKPCVNGKYEDCQK